MKKSWQQPNPNSDYSRPASFGDVRLFSVYVPTGRYASLDVIESAGWHKVNREYHVVRPEGGGDPLLLFTVAGRGQITVAGTEFAVSAEQVCLIPAWTPCEYTPCGEELWEFYWVHFSGRHALEVFSDLTRTAGFYADFPVASIRPLLERCLTTRFTAQNGELMASMLLNQILSELLWGLCSREKGSGLVNDLIVYLGADGTRTLAMEELEKKFHYSREHMIRAFHRQTNTTPYRYWREIKLAQAKQQLALTDRSLDEVAQSAGYSSIESFAKQFKLRYGMTPNRYRKSNATLKKEEN